MPLNFPNPNVTFPTALGGGTDFHHMVNMQTMSINVYISNKMGNLSEGWENSRVVPIPGDKAQPSTQGMAPQMEALGQSYASSIGCDKAC